MLRFTQIGLLAVLLSVEAAEARSQASGRCPPWRCFE